MRSEAVQGELKTRLMQLLLMAAYHPTVGWMEQVAGLLVSLPPSGGVNDMRIFVRYILSTQELEAVQSFRGVLRQRAPTLGDDLMTYAQELRAEGKKHNQAIRALGRHLCRVIYKLLKEERVYEIRD